MNKKDNFCVCVKRITFLQLLVFIFSFFCQPCPGLWNCKSVFLILEISQYDIPSWWVQIHQILQAGISRGVDSNETNRAGAGDVITSRSYNKPKPLYLHYHSAYGHQTPTPNVTQPFGHAVFARSRDKLKTYLPYHSAYGHQTWQAGD